MPNRPYTERDFDDMARRVVDKFASGQSPLADGAAHEAMVGQLNPDQIERLVQAVNTLAFLHMMEQREHGGDFTGEFDPADTRGVLQQILQQTPSLGGGHEPQLPHAEPDGDEWMPLHDEADEYAEPDGDEWMPLYNEAYEHAGPPDETNIHVHGDEPEVHVHNAPKKYDEGGEDKRDEKYPPVGHDDNDGPFPKGKKQKEKDDAEKKEKKPPAKAPEKDEKLASLVDDRRRRKLADQLDDQYLQAELAFDDGYARLSQALKVAHGAPRLEELEKDAVALDGGPHTVAVLNLLREERGLTPLELKVAMEKHAELQDRHVVDDYPALRELEQLIKIAEHADKLRKGAEYVRSQCS